MKIVCIDTLCFNERKTLGDKGHLSKVCNYASKTSTGNLNLHLSLKHEISICGEDNFAKILSYFKKYGGENSRKATSSHEVNRDFVIWICWDLLPFDIVGKEGFKSFFEHNAPELHTPTPKALSATALEDVYQAVKDAVKMKLTSVKSICLLFDGWTDQYKVRPYLGVRASFLDDWFFKVVT